MANYKLDLLNTCMSQPSPNAIGLTLDTSDLVLTTLGNAARLTHVPFLQGAAGLALNIVEIAQNVRSNKSAFKRLANDACALVYIIICNDGKVSAGSANETPAYLEHTKELSETLQEIYKFMQAQASKNKALRIIQWKSDAGVIQEYRERLRQSLDVFGLKSNLSIQESLAFIREHCVNIQKQVNQIQEPKQQGVCLAHSNEQARFNQKQELEQQQVALSAHSHAQAHQDQMTESTYEVDQEESEVTPDRDHGPETSLVAVLNRVHDAEVVDADMMAVGGDANARPGFQTRNRMPDVVTVINNSSKLKIHGGVCRAVGGNLYV